MRIIDLALITLDALLSFFLGFYRGTNTCLVADKRSFALYFSVKRNIFIIKKTLKDRISLYKTPHDARTKKFSV